MVPTDSPASNAFSEISKNCCLPGQITYRADTSATRAPCPSASANDLSNRSPHHIQVQISGLGWKPRGLSDAAVFAAPVGAKRVENPANPCNLHGAGRLL